MWAVGPGACLHAVQRNSFGSGLEEAADRRLGGYSKGMLQRIGLAQTLIQNPRLVILDEPTAGVDPDRPKDSHKCRRIKVF